jgi:hypothetical protein
MSALVCRSCAAKSDRSWFCNTAGTVGKKSLLRPKIYRAWEIASVHKPKRFKLITIEKRLRR